MSVGARRSRLERLKELQMKVNEAKKANHMQVVEEDKRRHLPHNWEAKQARMRWQEEEETFRAECAKKGLDADRVRNLNVSADLVRRLELRKQRKRPHVVIDEDEANDVPGFTSYADASHKKYLKQTKTLKPDLEAYRRQKERLGELVYPTADTIGLIEATSGPSAHESSREAIERMAAVLKEQETRKAAFSRRRAFDPDADVDYINERNKRYNELLERYYGDYTAETKQNLERGTAL